MVCSLFRLLMRWPLEMLWLVRMSIWLGRIGLLPRSVPSLMPLGWQGARSLHRVLFLEGGRLNIGSVTLGGKRVHKCRPDLVDPASANEVHLFRSCSIALLLTLKRRLRVVACFLSRVARGGFTLARSLELSNQWSCITGHGPVGCLDWVSLMSGPR